MSDARAHCSVSSTPQSSEEHVAFDGSNQAGQVLLYERSSAEMVVNRTVSQIHLDILCNTHSSNKQVTTGNQYRLSTENDGCAPSSFLAPSSVHPIVIFCR